jgi:hypothetical protein
MDLWSWWVAAMLGMIERMFESLESEVEALGETDVDGMGSVELGELLETLQGLRAKVEAAEARVLARWDGDRCWADDGARGGAAWLAWKQRIPTSVAKQRIRHARGLRDLPAVADAWAAGEIDRTHVNALLNVRTGRTEDAFLDGHKELLDAARTLWFRQFKRICDIWSQLADPDGSERSAEEERAARAVHLSQSWQGMFFGTLTFDRVSGTIVHDTVGMIERELFDAEWAQLRVDLGREPTMLDVVRTPAQRRADAMVEMAVRARTAPSDGRRPVPLFSVVVGYETFAGPVRELWNGTVITPGTIAQWLSEADVERIVFDTPSRVIDVGANRRFFRGALRRAIELRDRTCFHPTCDEPPDRPNIDHEHEASKGGETTQTNGRMGCSFHNRRRNTHPDDWHDDPTTEPHIGPDPPR